MTKQDTTRKPGVAPKKKKQPPAFAKRKKQVKMPKHMPPPADDKIIGLEEEAVRRGLRQQGTAKKKEKLRIGGIDVPFFMLLIMLMLVGLVMLFSASFVSAYYRHGDAMHFIIRQAVFAVLGIVAMFFVAAIPYQKLHKLAFPALAVAILMLVAVLFIGTELNNAKRWIYIGSLFSFQPSELAKAAVILSFSSLAVRLGAKMKTFTYGILPFIAIIGVMGVLMLKQPHLSGTVIIAATGVVIMFLGGVHVGKMAALGGTAVAGLLYAVLGLGYGMNYVNTRIQTWLNPMEAHSDDAYQILQSLYAIGSGGLWGLGLGQSRQKHLFLPEPYNDFIFSVICEELGFVGAALILILFAALIVRGYYIALRARDTFGTLLAAGVTTQIAIQTILNIAVVTGLIPVTGVSLPFFSQGGTSLVVLFAEVGLIMSVSKQIPAPKQG